MLDKTAIMNSKALNPGIKSTSIDTGPSTNSYYDPSGINASLFGPDGKQYTVFGSGAISGNSNGLSKNIGNNDPRFKYFSYALDPATRGKENPYANLFGAPTPGPTNTPPPGQNTPTPSSTTTINNGNTNLNPTPTPTSVNTSPSQGGQQRMLPQKRFNAFSMMRGMGRG